MRIANVYLSQEDLERLERAHITIKHTGAQSHSEGAAPLYPCRFSLNTVFEAYTMHFGGEVNALGAFSYCQSWLPSAQIGRYTSIAEHVRTMGDAHPLDWVSTHPFQYQVRHWHTHTNLKGVRAHIGSFDYRPAHVTIGDDVWIGEDVRIVGGATIGTGAVVLAGAIVTKDVPPYAIMGGVPARVLKMRFAPELVARLLASRWWDYPFEQFKGYRFDAPARFLDQFESDRDAGRLAPLPEERRSMQGWFKHLGITPEYIDDAQSS